MVVCHDLWPLLPLPEALIFDWTAFFWTPTLRQSHMTPCDHAASNDTFFRAICGGDEYCKLSVSVKLVEIRRWPYIVTGWRFMVSVNDESGVHLRSHLKTEIWSRYHAIYHYASTDGVCLLSTMLSLKKEIDHFKYPRDCQFRSL